MIDLKFSYTHPTGDRVIESYNLVFDFTDAVENGTYPKEFLSYGEVDARFFENPLLDKHFETVEELYKHCVSIMVKK